MQEKEDILLNKAIACMETSIVKEDSLDEHDTFGKYLAMSYEVYLMFGYKDG